MWKPVKLNGGRVPVRAVGQLGLLIQTFLRWFLQQVAPTTPAARER